MKKMIIVLAFLASNVAAQAQELRAGVKGAFNSTWLFNKEVSDAGDELDYASTFGSQFGVYGSYAFNEAMGVSLELLLGQVNQKYTGVIGGISYDAQRKLSFIDIPVLFRFTSEKGPYLEVGPQFSILSSAKSEPTSGLSTSQEKDQYNSSNFSGILGFGIDIEASEKIDIIAGLRFGYGFSDMTDGVNGPGKNAAGKVVPTNTAVGGLHVGIVYKLTE